LYVLKNCFLNEMIETFGNVEHFFVGKNIILAIYKPDFYDSYFHVSTL